MNLPGRILACSLLAPVLGSSPGEQRIRFDPAPDTRLERTLETGTDFGLDDFSLVVDGEDLGAVMGGLDLSITTEERAVVQDHFVKLGAGRPAELLRTFTDLGGSVSVSFMSEFASQDQDMDCSSKLEGSAVRFLWDEEKGAYGITFENGESSDVLEHLEEDMDCRVLLPGKEVAEGDTWEVPLLDLASIASPGGELSLLPEGAEIEDFEEFGQLFREKIASLADLLEGSCVCTFSGLEEEDPRLAEISIAIAVEAEVDLADAILELIDTVISEIGDIGEEEFPGITIETADLSFEYEGAGTLIWNVAQNRMVSLDLSGDLAFSVDFAVSVDVADESHEAELFAEMTGSMTETLVAKE
jgi:hypothetical protein